MRIEIVMFLMKCVGHASEISIYCPRSLSSFFVPSRRVDALPGAEVEANSFRENRRK